MVNTKSRHFHWLLPLLIFILALIPRIVQLGTFWGTDERYHWELSNEFFSALLRRDWANTVPQGLPGVTLAWIDSIAIALKYSWSWLILGGSVSPEQIMAANRPFALLAGRQVPVVLANTLIVVGLYGLSWPILGRKAAWMGVTFIILDPFFLAESRVLRFEALVAGLMSLSLLAGLLYLKEQRPYALVLSAVLAALAILTKSSAVFLFPAVVLLGAATVLASRQVSGPRQERAARGMPSEASRRAGARQVSVNGELANDESVNDKSAIGQSVPAYSPHLLTPPQARKRRASVSQSSNPPPSQPPNPQDKGLPIFRWILKYLIWGSLVIFFFWLFWPAMWVAPLQTLHEVKVFAESAGDEGFGGRGVFFWGQIYPDDPGYWFYPVALLFRLTPLVLMGLVATIVSLLSMVKERWPIRDQAGWQWWGTVLLLVYSVLFALLMTLGAKKYDRYLMPIFPTLDLVAGVGWLWAGEWVTRRWLQPQQARLALGTGWAGLLVLQILTTLPHLPYYYTYYNPLLGGPRQAVNYIRVGYAEGLDQVAAYLEGKPDVAELKLASANSSKFDGLFSGQTIALDNLSGKWVQADYVLIYISQLQRGKHSEDILDYLARHEPEYTLKLHGLEYAWLYPGPAAQYYGGGHKLEGRGTFYGYDLDKTELAAGESLPVTLYWRNEGQREDDRFFVRLMDLDGYVWAEAISHPRPGFEENSRRENSIVESEAALTLPVGMPPGDYFFKPGFRTSGGEIIGYFELPPDAKPIKVTTAKTYPPVETFRPPHSSRLMANHDLMLLGYDLDPKASAPGSVLWVTLYWQALTDVTHDYVILLRLLDQTGQELAYWLGRPVRSGYPTTEWRAEQIVQDPWQLALPPGTVSGSYDLEIAVFDAATGAEVTRAQLGSLTAQSP